MQMLCGGAMLALVGIAHGELGQVHPSAISNASLAAVLFLIVFGSLVAFTAYGWLLKNAPTRLLSTYAYVNPAVAVFLGWAFIGERVGGREIAAGLVILSSIGLIIFARAPREQSEPTPESLPFHIREQEARGTELRTVPRLHELVRVT
jgi:drug/metabolite transporter (DMT)-like permease